jgi:hypothetical protein
MKPRLNSVFVKLKKRDPQIWNGHEVFLRMDVYEGGLSRRSSPLIKVPQKIP